MNPAEIWLLIGVPVDQEQLARRLCEGDAAQNNDFCLEYVPPGWPGCGSGKTSEWISTRSGKRYQAAAGAALARIRAAARSSGLTVWERADLTALREAARHARVIIIASHWKAHEFVANDFGPRFAEEAAERLAGEDTPVARWLRRRIASPPWYSAPFRRPVSLRLALNELADADLADQPVPENIDRYFEIPATRAARRRAAADALFAGLVRPGNRLELWDGLHPREAVAEALGPFAGILDLTTCTSTWLGDYISHALGRDVRTVQFPTVQHFSDAGARLAAVFDLVVQGWQYLEARQEVQRVFEQVAMQAGGSRLS